MNNILLNERDIDFLLYEFLDTASLLERPRYSEHSEDIFKAAVRTANTIARKYFLNHYREGDESEPALVDNKVDLVPETHSAWNAVAEAGFMAAHQDFSEGGLQLPEIICSAASAYFRGANVATSSYQYLTIGACNLIRSFGDDKQKAMFVPSMMDGRFSGTMALTEPEQGSALADIKTTAKKQSDGSFLIKGQKTFITCGDHELTENIIHLVLAKIPGAADGVKGISLFIVPQYIVNDDGSVGSKNDISLLGLLHKMGSRNATSAMLNFGEQTGAIGYLLGEPNQGLSHMFQMMNEARIGVGMGAAALAYRGYLLSLDYARNRPQGRLPSNKNPSSSQVMIIEHADVRRMLLTQKAYAEGAMALCLYASSLMEDASTATTEQDRYNAATLLDLLTPIVKSWPSKEELVTVAAGDTVRWIVGDTSSGAGADQRVNVLVKPIRKDLRTNLVITTDRRTYLMELIATEKTWMASASWEYPRDRMLALRKQSRAAEVAAPIEQGLSLERLRFRYAFSGDQPSWRPLRAFDDGHKVYIQFPAGIAQGELPPLFVIGPQGDGQLVNYRFRSPYYIVDRLFGAAELRLGDEHGEVVRIERTDGVRRQ